jgi:mannose-6-phosphate isomerase-like protein (cupin superfamily)
MDQRFETRQLLGGRDVVAPDGSDVRVLLQLARGGMAHFELGARRVSRAVAHHSVDEIWYILRGRGQMWRRQAGRRLLPCGPAPASPFPRERIFSSGPPAAARSPR